jgi:hypothetical protein
VEIRAVRSWTVCGRWLKTAEKMDEPEAEVTPKTERESLEQKSIRMDCERNVVKEPGSGRWCSSRLVVF